MKYITLGLFFLCIINSGYTQRPDSIIFEESVSFIRSIHAQSLIENQNLLIGSEYILYNSLGNEHPYFLSNKPIPGKVVFNGEIFESVPLLFDMNKDKLIVLNQSYGALMELASSSIREFKINNHRFIYLPNNNIGIKNGFYELLSDGRLKVLSKRTKEESEKLYGTTYIKRFYEHEQYFIIEGDRAFRITSKKDLFKLTNDKKEFKLFIRENKLFQKGYFEKSLIDSMNFFEEQG